MINHTTHGTVPHCDKETRKSPCSGDVYAVECPDPECPRVYRRCKVHGGREGAKRSQRSQRSHWTLHHDGHLDSSVP